MQKVVAKNPPLGYSLGMTNTDTPTAAPQFRDNNVVAVPINTETKTTQAQTFANHFAAVDFELDFGYHITAYKAGEKIGVGKYHDGYTILDGYGCHAFNAVIVNGVRTETLFIPAGLLIERTFSIVREYKTTTWEIL